LSSHPNSHADVGTNGDADAHGNTRRDHVTDAGTDTNIASGG
jgi:hypothetical protein